MKNLKAQKYKCQSMYIIFYECPNNDGELWNNFLFL